MKTKKTSKLKIFLLRTFLICFALNLTGFVSAAHACTVEYFRKSSHHKYLKTWPYSKKNGGDADYIGKIARKDFDGIEVVDGENAAKNAQCVIEKLEKYDKDYNLSCNKIDAKCIEKFQTYCKIDIDGLVGPQTARTLNKGCGDPKEDEKKEEEVVEEEEEDFDDECSCKTDEECNTNPCFQDMCVGDRCFCSKLSRKCVEKVPFSILPVERKDWVGKPKKYIQENNIRTTDLGNIELFDLPRYIKHISNFITFLAASVAVLMIVYGGYRYIAGGLAGDKEAGKNIISKALIGLGIVIFAYVIVETLSIASTSQISKCGNGLADKGEECDKEIEGEEQCPSGKVCSKDCRCVES